MSTDYPNLTPDSIAALYGLLDRGLCSGLGVATGRVCVEAAWWLARGGDPNALSDENECVHPVVRSYRVRLNDSSLWSSPAARSSGMRRLAVAGLGTAHLDGRVIAEALALSCVQHETADALVAAGLPDLATACREAKTLAEARTAAGVARAARGAGAAYAARAAAADAAANAANADAWQVFDPCSLLAELINA